MRIAIIKISRLISIIIVISLSIYFITTAYIDTQAFNSLRALEFVKYQVNLGPRTPGSEAHEKTAEWIISSLKTNKWDVVTQDTEISGISIKNIIAKRGMGEPWIIIASHYDSRLLADRDQSPENRKLPVDGANDGASSVAILIELARILPSNTDMQIWLVFFDAEDNGNIPGYEWIMGSQYFVSQLEGKPDSVAILDMVGDEDLNIYMERNSNPELNQEIWNVASELGFPQFIPMYKYAIIDDHIPFLKAGIRAVDIIDFDYPHWHTKNDTLNKVSAESLKAVGETILYWLEQYH